MPQEKAVHLSMKEKQRVEVIHRVASGKLTVDECAKILKKSRRTVFRMCARLESKGLEGLLHGNKGRTSPKRTSNEARDSILKLARSTYVDVNDTHMMELLEERNNITVGRETLRGM